MTETFNTKALANDRLLVTGNPGQQTILYVEQWNQIKREFKKESLLSDFDSKIEEFFAPLIEAQAQLERLLDLGRGRQRKASPLVLDPAFTIVLNEGKEHQQGEDAILIDLSTHSAIARLIEIGQLDRLIWVGDDTIEILEYEAPAIVDEGVAADLAEFTAAVEQAVAVANDES